MFKKFKEVLNPLCVGQIMIVFTRLEYSKKNNSIQKEEGSSETTKKEEISEYFRTELGFDTVNHPVWCVFLDSLSFKKPDLCEAEDLASLTAQFHERKTVSNNRSKRISLL